MKINKASLIFLSLLSGILLALAWPEYGFPGLLFIGFVPLMFIEDHIACNRERFSAFSTLFYSYPAFFLWNLLTTWWICNSTFMGAVMAIVLNSLFVAMVFQAYSWAKNRLNGKGAGYMALVSFWIAFEYLHLNWILTWPWLVVGNGFASYYNWVQWYEYTGVMGGTLWVLVGNILVFEGISIGISNYELGIRNYVLRTEAGFRYSKSSRLRLILNSEFLILNLSFILWIGLPIGISFIIYHNYTEKKDPVNFVVVQPNVDPYSEQYSLPPEQVVGRIMQLAEPLIDSTTNFLVAPESAIQESMWENEMSTFSTLRLLKEVVGSHPQLNILIGGSTFKAYGKEPPTRTARRFTNSENYYDAYNTAILINASDSMQLYHKSKLTPGVEAMPSFRGLKWLEDYAIDLGGTVGSLGTDDSRKVYSTEKTVPVAPIICYESVFGEFFAEFVKNGAEVMIIITNDGWWGNTPGHRQHFAFAHLRAIETRRSIARSANTGISAFIDQRGDAHDVTGYWVPAVIKGSLNANRNFTFYVKNGDYIARIAVLMTGLLLLISLVLPIFSRWKK